MRALGWLVIAGCWQSAAVPISEPTNATVEGSGQPVVAPKRDAGSPYAEVAGVWRGEGFQYNTKTHWDIEMTLGTRGDIGEVIGTIAYEGGGCTANLIRELEQGDHGEVLVMRERLQTGQGRCVDNGWIRIPRRPIVDELEWRWDFADKREGASSTLRRD